MSVCGYVAGVENTSTEISFSLVTTVPVLVGERRKLELLNVLIEVPLLN